MSLCFQVYLTNKTISHLIQTNQQGKEIFDPFCVLGVRVFFSTSSSFLHLSKLIPNGNCNKLRLSNWKRWTFFFSFVLGFSLKCLLPNEFWDAGSSGSFYKLRPLQASTHAFFLTIRFCCLLSFFTILNHQGTQHFLLFSSLTFYITFCFCSSLASAEREKILLIKN